MAYSTYHATNSPSHGLIEYAGHRAERDGSRAGGSGGIIIN